ncbi:glycosyltransferase [Methylosinus sp. LW4]|uniref:glycosyltransferase n=1 Tax=Methylosinus sp. LW4 TaxID=136993 RepID=UPI00039CBA3F|nr:glycosyltransferase [Methylosinus sp. LW4]
MSLIHSLEKRLGGFFCRISKARRYFDPDYYLRCYLDVAEAQIEPFAHYFHEGWREGRNPRADFNSLWYLQMVTGADGSGIDPLSHHVRNGAVAGVDTVPGPRAGIDWIRAAAANEKLPQAIRAYASEYAFILNSRLLNPAYYRTVHENVVGDPIEHFIRIGWQLKYNPCPDFHTEWYLETNPDVALARINPLVHYLQYGAQEGREPRPRHYHFPVATQAVLARKKAVTARKKERVPERNVVTYEDYLAYLDKSDETLDVRVERIEERIGQRFCAPFKQSSRALQAFEPIAQNDQVSQFFVAPVDFIHSFNMFFFTYCQPNGAKIKISLYALMDDENKKALLHEEVVSPEMISDGHSFTVWPKAPVYIKNVVLQLDVKVLTLKQGSQFTIAGRQPSYRAACFPIFSANESMVFALEFNLAPPREAHKTFAFISGCPGDAFRYRCEHQAESLQNCGYSVDVFQPHDFPYEQLLKNYSIIVAHRVPDDGAFQSFAKQALERGVMLVYDVDDLIFDPARVTQIDAYNSMNNAEKSLYLNGVTRYNAAMSRCGYVSVSTEKLHKVVGELFPDKLAFVIRNKVSQAMIEGAVEACKTSRENTDHVVIAYFSGSKTHSKDFSECAGALVWIMQQYPQTQLLIVGHLTLPQQLDGFSDRIKRYEFMPWSDLPKVYHLSDISLAPLEYDNEFTEAKSELKYLEAALLGVPTVACDLGAFRVFIQNGVDGVLCADEREWREGLSKLVSDSDYRRSIGLRAQEEVMARSTTLSTPELVYERWRGACARQTSRGSCYGLRVAFVTRAPIAETGGGYKKIFILAKHLADKGYDVRVHVEAIAHLADKTDAQIKQFCHVNFGIDAEIIRVGHSLIGPVDVAIATNWPTASTVAKLHNAKFKAYFIQDYEPDFYPAGSPDYLSAEKTYDEKLAFITIGDYLARRLADRRKWIRAIPFAVDRHFHEAGRARRTGRGVGGKERCVVLFFARPGIERRNFSAGVAALARLNSKYRDTVKIALYGLDHRLDLPFPYEDLGKISQEKLAGYMVTVDIHLSFSLTNISTVIFEAMACGCACIEADVPSVRAMVLDGVNCLLGAPEDGAFKALDALTKDADLRRRIADAGYAFAQQLTEKNMCESFERCIDDSILSADIAKTGSLAPA